MAYKSYTLTITSANKTTPLLIFLAGTTSIAPVPIKWVGSPSDPIPVTVANIGTHTVLIGGDEKTICKKPLKKTSTIQFNIIGGTSLYVRLTGTTTTKIAILVGRQ